MKNKKTWVYAGLVTTAAIGMVLTGCAKEEKTTSTSTSSPSAAATPAAKGKVSITVYDRAKIPAEEGNFEKNRWVDYMNKNGPVDLTIVPVPRDKTIDKLNVLFASGSAPDIIVDYNAPDRSTWYESKQLMPLNDMIDKYSTVYKQQLEKYPVLKKLGTRADGKIYDIGAVRQGDINWMLWVRTDWLKKLNLEAPKTAEDMLKIAKAFVEQDPDGNGKKDTYGMALGGFLNWKVADYMFGVPYNTNYQDQNSAFSVSWKNMQAATAFKKQLFDGGLVDKDFLTDQNGDKAKRDFINGKLGFYMTQRSEAQGVFESLRKNDPNAQVTPIALPSTPNGQFSPAINTPFTMAGVVNAKAKDPKAVMQYIDFLNTEKTVKTLRWGTEGEHYKPNANGCPVPTDAAKNTAERSWNADYSILVSEESMMKCDPVLDLLDANNATQMEYKKLVEAARKIYLNPSNPMPGSVIDLSLPSLPSELNTIVASVNFDDELKKSVVTGNYSADSVITNIQGTWTKAGGDKVDEFYNNWYKQNKTNAVSIKDVYDLLVQQQKQAGK
ncbi:extracellular solute-binding protein [Paenibacillus qinlingensis]|uniref:Aldouronate transport system substrate-binding protein n=1 Tax=Paenibacillus qinlingensis TaxID=1837343 RepID=A0ABU1NWC9_9BACL|nr:extracellular solute-binding protein [Paenibacillus qinlingensis]MDR6551770.1 putative aldouronate transport system substrate-binding protein [Paenibacillus qinlingensis]